METLRQAALTVLLERDADKKAERCLAIDLNAVIGTEPFVEVEGIPGRPDKPGLVHHTALKPRSVNTLQGRAALLHAIAHIEFNAIDLACDITARFSGMPDEFYRQWMQVAKEEALHFSLLRDHLRTLGYEYGDFPAHGALWEMAEKTKHDLLARLALVPRTLEARGLDASPPIKAKLVAAGDTAAGDILDVILRDEVGHVAIGNHWYGVMCQMHGLDPIRTYPELAHKYGAPRPRGPFNMEARKAAGFSDAELAYLTSMG